MSQPISQERGKRRASKPPVYFRARKLVDPTTGEEVMALVPATHTDAQQPAWKRVYDGERVRAEISRPRNPGFHRTVHAIAKMAVNNIDQLSHLDPHSAIKRLQAEAGLECDVVMLDAISMWDRITVAVVKLLPDPGTLAAMEVIGELLDGEQLPVSWPRSIAFDAMDEDPFRELARGLCTHLSRRYWPTCTPEQIAVMAERHLDGA